MTKELDTTTTHDAVAMPLPDVTDNGLELLQKQAEAMGAAHKLATVLCNTKMVPATFQGKPDDGAAAILYGAELGLKPQQALQQVFVVHGQPSIYARTMVALLKAKGYRFQTVESTDKQVTVTGTSPRGEQETSTWTIDRAVQAGYTSNKKYTSDPQAMLYAKAAAEVCRKLAPDVLLGITYTKEEFELEQPVRATATRVQPGRGTSGLKAALTAKPEEPEFDMQAAREKLENAATHDELTELMEKVATSGITEDQHEELAVIANQRWENLNQGGAQ